MKPHVLVPDQIAHGIATCGANWGTLDVKYDMVENLVVVSGYSKTEAVKRPAATDWLKTHYTAQVSESPGSGFWYRVSIELHQLGMEATRRGGAIQLDAFRKHITGWQMTRLDEWFVVTVADDSGDPHFMAWQMTQEGAHLISTERVRDQDDLFAPLGDAWPQAALADKLVTVIGTGSIGSSAAEALSSYAIRNLALVDPDRLCSHNFARHRANRDQVGRMKVNAVADMLTDRDSGVTIGRYPLSVIDDADVMRPLFTRSTCILVASDGIASRRAANHLACWARVPIVFACVLEDGRIGEVIRVRPGVTACLLCAREQLAADGGIDPEPSIDLGYGQGHRHRAMTAVGGDLDLVGRLAARAVASTMLEDAGYLSERLPNDHAVVGLRPAIDRQAEPPFDVSRSLQIAWQQLAPPLPGCPSCGGRT